MTRKYTTALLDLVDDGVLDARAVLRDALCYMSEQAVQDFAESNGYIEEDDDVLQDEDEDEDENEDESATPTIREEWLYGK